MVYKCEYFTIEELVPPQLFETVHEDVLWGMFDPDLLRAADWLRSIYGSATINTWKWGGGFTQSGLRTKDSKYYSEGSAHSRGMALDLKFSNTTPQEIRDTIKRDIGNGVYIPYLTEIEEGTDTWLHISTRPRAGYGNGKVYFFHP